MDSFEVIDTDSNSRSFSSKDYCFLPELLVTCVQNGPVLNNENFKFENIKTALPTASSDASIDEVSKRLTELSDANKLLKETLNKNKLLLKKQMEILPAWQENNKQNLEKAKENIDRLERENADLHSRLNSLEIECLNFKNQKICKNCESLAVALQSLQNNKESAKKTSDLSGEISKFNNFFKNHREILLPIYDQLYYLYRTGKHTDRQKEELNNVLICLKKEISVLSEDICSIVHTEHETRHVTGKKEQKVTEELMLQAFTEFENLKKEFELKKKELHTSEELMLQTATEMENLRKELEEKNKKLHTSEELMLQTSTEMENLRKELDEKIKKLHTSEKLMLQISTEIENLRKELEKKIKKAEDAEALLHQNVGDMELLRKNLEAKDKKAEDAEALLCQNISETEFLRKMLETKDKKAEDAEALLCQNISEIELLRKMLEAKDKKAEDAEAMFHQKVSEVELLTKNMKLDLSSGQEKQLSKIVEGYAKSIQDIGKELKSQLEKLKNKLDNESTCTKKYKKLCQYLQQQKEEYQLKFKYSETSNVQIIKYLHEEAMNLQKCLKLEQKTNQKDKERLSVLMMQCEELYVGFIQAIQLLEVQSKSERFIAEEFTVLSENDSSSRERIDHLTARVMDLELSLADKDEDMKKLLEELVSVKEEAEMVPILQTELSAALEHAVSTIDSKECEEIENLEKQLKKHRKEESDSSGYYSSKKRNGP